MGWLSDQLAKADPTTRRGRENLLMMTGVGGLMAGGLMKKKRRAEEDIAKREADVEQQIADMPTYQTPEEMQQNLALMQEGRAGLGTAAEAIRGTTALAGEATDIARARTGAAEMPGEALARRDIQQTSARTAQNILQAGGGAAALGAIAQAGLGEQSAYGQLAQQRAQYRSQAEQDLANALRAEAGFTSAAEAQAAGLETQGIGMESQALMGLAGERGKEFESGLNRYLTGLQYDIDKTAQVRAEEAARQERVRQGISSGLQAVGTLGGAAVGSPQMGSAIGGMAGGLATAGM